MPDHTISAGDLDRLIVLQHGTASNDPDTNEPISTFATYATVWAKMEFHRATEGEAASREYADQGLYFTIRHRTDVLPEDRIVFESQNYEIIGRPRELGRRQGLKIQARLVE
jgi:SPP1 family predicted phage head-tail adaptor